jgi:hypothetical protein
MKKEDVTYINQEAFELAKEKVLQAERGTNGIGTLGEKTVHAILKLYYEPNADCHEVALDGYVADICNGDGVIEVQSAGFNRLRDKLAVFLNHYPVTVVYPMPYNKWVTWIEPETGERSARRKAPKCWTPYYAFFELYKIKDYLTNPNLHLKLVLMDLDEYRLLNGWNESRKRGSTRFDRVPIGIRREVSIDQVEDYLQLVPYELGEVFDTRAFAGAAHIGVDTARQVVNILNYVGTLSRVGKKGNSILYSVNER